MFRETSNSCSFIASASSVKCTCIQFTNITDFVFKGIQFNFLSSGYLKALSVLQATAKNLVWDVNDVIESKIQTT